MHTITGEAKAARADLQSIYDRFLRHIVGSSMPLGPYCWSPLHAQVFWWQQTLYLEFWNTIAASPVNYLFHSIVLDNIYAIMVPFMSQCGAWC